MAFTLTILGSSSALPTSDRFTSAHILNVYEHLFLIDCGEGTQIRMRQNKIRFGKIDHIFISHLHGDHFFGILGLLSSFNILGRKNPIHIYSFKGIEEIINTSLKCSGQEFSYPIIYHNLDNDKSNLIYSDKRVEVISFPLNHRIPTCGFVFREKPKGRRINKSALKEFNIPVSRLSEIKNGNDYITESGKIIKNELLTHAPDSLSSYAYCSDTLFNPDIIPYINKVSLLYHEATFLEDMSERAITTYHTTARQAAEIAKAAYVQKLLIGHFSVRYKELDGFIQESRTIFENTDLAFDGLQISF